MLRTVLLVLCLGAATLFPRSAFAQTLSLSNGVHTYVALTNFTVTMTGRCELRITATANPIPGCIIHLNSPDAWFILANIRRLPQPPILMRCA